MSATGKQRFGSMSAAEKKKYYDDMHNRLSKDTDNGVSAGVSTRVPFPISAELISEVGRYIAKHYVAVRQAVTSHRFEDDRALGISDRIKPKAPKHAALPSSSTLDEIMGRLDEPFDQTLFS